jgi:hypothetical protein
MHIHVQLYIYFAICIHTYFLCIHTHMQVLSNLDYKHIKAITKRQNVSQTQSLQQKKLTLKNKWFNVYCIAGLVKI